MYLIPLVVQVVDDRIGFVHELFSFVKGRREKAEGGAVPVPRDDGFSVVIHDDFELLEAFLLANFEFRANRQWLFSGIPGDT